MLRLLAAGPAYWLPVVRLSYVMPVVIPSPEMWLLVSVPDWFPIALLSSITAVFDATAGLTK